MAKFRVEKTNNYTVMSNFHLRDRNLSLKAKGLLSYMLSLPDDWDYSLAGLCAICKENRTAIRSTLKELQLNNYLIIEKTRGTKGYFEYEYLIYEEPQTREKEPDIENPYVDKPDTENKTQINNNKQNDKDDKTKSSFFYDNINYLTKELIKGNYITENDSQIIYYDNLFDDLLEENEFKDLLIIVHYIISKVIDRDFYDEDGNKIENKFGYFKNSILNNIDKLNFYDEELWGEEVQL